MPRHNTAEHSTTQQNTTKQNADIGEVRLSPDPYPKPEYRVFVRTIPALYRTGTKIDVFIYDSLTLCQRNDNPVRKDWNRANYENIEFVKKQGLLPDSVQDGYR
jgi:hypothetical protein